MIARRLAVALAVVTLVGSAVYLFVYLYRWEWNRALVSGVFLLATEIGLVGYAIVSRLRSLEAALDRRAPGPDERVLQRVKESAPPSGQHFAWLRPDTDRLAVFVPILLGAGFLFSALAWVVERVARSVATPTLERRLATRLSVFTLPAGHLVVAGDGEGEA